MLKERTLTITVTVDMDKAIRDGEIEASVWSQIPELVFHSLLDTWSNAWERRGVDIAYPRWDGPGVEVEE